MQPEDAFHLQEESRERTADGARERQAAEIEGGKPRAVFGGKPQREVVDHAGKETRLRQSQCEAQRVETERPLRQRTGRGNQEYVYERWLFSRCIGPDV